MSGKFMKVRRVVIPTLTLIIMASQLMGCAATSQDETLGMLNNATEIEVEVAELDTDKQGTQKSIESIDWIELASLTNNPEIRENWNDSLPSTTVDGKDVQTIFVDESGSYNSNSTLKEALSNQSNVFSTLATAENGDSNFYSKAFLGLWASYYYSDMDELDIPNSDKVTNYTVDNEAAYNTAFLAGINAYFNLLPDYEPAYANMGSSLTRKEFMTMVFRADTPVQELEMDKEFSSAVGETEYNLYAQNLQNNSYLDIESGSLDELTYNGTMTRAEAIYMIVSRYYRDELSDIDTNLFTGYETEFTDAKDSGATSTYEKGTEHWKSNTLNDAIQNPDAGLPTELFSAITIAAKHNIINVEDDTRWDEALTREDALQLLVNTYTSSILSENNIEITSDETVDFQTTEEREEAKRQADIERYKQLSKEPDAKTMNSEAYQLGAEILNNRPQAEKEADAADGYLGYDVKMGSDGCHLPMIWVKYTKEKKDTRQIWQNGTKYTIQIQH